MAQTIKAIIADDEKELRRHLIKMLEKLWPDLDIIGEAQNGPETVDLVTRLHPDIVFLDIRMPGQSGIEVARQICRQTTIIFITAYDQYAVEAFENEAMDYILKPVQQERLLASIERYQRQIADKQGPPRDLTPLLAKLEKNLQAGQSSTFLQWIRAQHGDTIRLIPVEDVVMFQSSEKYTVVVTQDRESLIRKTLKELETELDPKVFWKVHRSTIVNVSAISKISKSMTGKYVIKLNGVEEPVMVSRSYVHLFKQM